MSDMSNDFSRRDLGLLHCSTTQQPSSSSSSPLPTDSSSAGAPLHTFDSTRYHVSVQRRDHPTASQPPKLTASSTYILAEEHRNPTAGGLLSANDGLLSSGSEDTDLLRFQLDEIFDASMLDFLQVVFLIVDAVLLLYRVSSIYIACNELNHIEPGHALGGSGGGPPSIRTGQLTANGVAAVKGILRHSRPHDVEGLSDGPGQELIRQLIFSDGQEIPVSSSEETDCHGSTVDTRLTRITEYDVSLNCSQSQSPGSNCAPTRPVLTGSLVVGGDPTPRYPTVKPVLEHIARNGAIPRILASVFLIVLVCLCARFSLTVLDVAWLRDWSVLASYVDVVQLRVNETNAYLQQHAEHLNDVIVRDCRGQATVELVNLQSLIEHFRIGSKSYLIFI